MHDNLKRAINKLQKREDLNYGKHQEDSIVR